MNTHAQKLHTHFEDPIAQVKVRRIMETLKHPVCTVSWVARLCRRWLSSGESDPIFPREKSQWNHTVTRKKKKKSHTEVEMTGTQLQRD